MPLAITASRFDDTVRVIDLTTGQAACRPLEFPDRPTALATPRKRLAVGFGMMRARQEDFSQVGDVIAGGQGVESQCVDPAGH